MPTASPSLMYWRGLTGIRGIAIATVMVFHTRLSALPGGGAGVDIFFVLSGFLITLSLLGLRERSTTPLREFWRRRVLRILPAMLVAVPVGALLTWLTWEEARDGLAAAAFSSVAFFANFRAAHDSMSMGVFLPHWSLALEEQFYVLWPPVLFFLLRAKFSPRRLVALTAGLAAAAFVWRNVVYHHVTFDELLYRPDLRAQPILLGCALGLAVGYDLVPRGRAARAAIQALALAGCGFLVVFMWKMQWFHDRAGLSYGLAMVSVVAAALILERVVAPTAVLTAVLENPALLWLGQISYSLYLIHVPVIVVVRRSIDGRASMAPAIALALVCGAALHYLVEAPFLRLKRGRTVAIVASDETTGR